MQKATIELFKVHKNFKVKFSLITKDDDPNSFQKLLNKFNYKGNEYIKITPHPFITIDITTKEDKKDGWNSNQSFNMNRKELFSFIMKLKNLVRNFISHKSLFYYDQNGLLMVNQQEANNIKETIIAGNKRILMQPCVVDNEEDKQRYEGMFLFINSIDYYSYLTYFEMQYLIQELDRIDINALTLNLINTVIMNEHVEAKELEIKKPVITEQSEEMIIDTKPYIKIEEPNTIPEI